MGWSELLAVPNEYNEELKKVDEALLQLIVERKQLVAGKHCSPPRELMEEWTSRFGLGMGQLNWLLNGFRSHRHYSRPHGPGELQTVLPIMKKTLVDGVLYELTHSMQHANASLVFVEVSIIEGGDDVEMLHPQLKLEITGDEEYTVDRGGNHGGGREAHLRFTVTPPLPEQLDTVRFSLIPYANPMERPRNEVILDKEVYFA